MYCACRLPEKHSGGFRQRRALLSSMLITIWLLCAMASEQTAGIEHDSRSGKIERLLDVALRAFGRQGRDGARVDAIARDAGLNKRLLYHYVGNKEALFAAVLDRACTRVLRQPQAPLADEWRVICHAAASGADIGALQGLLAERSEATAAQLGLVLLTSLLPDLADRALHNGEGTPAGRERCLAAALKRHHGAGTAPQPMGGTQAAAPKPRLKLRPELRPSGSGGSQVSVTRSDSKRSK